MAISVDSIHSEPNFSPAPNADPQDEKLDRDADIPPPDSPYAWAVLAGGFVNTMLSIGVITSFGVYLEEYQTNEFPGVSSSMLSWIGTLAFAVMCLGGIGVGILYERADARIVNISGAFLAGMGLIAASFCDAPWKLMLTQGVMFGTGASFLYLSGTTFATQWFDKYRALATGIALSGGGIGGLWLSFANRAMVQNIGRGWAQRIVGVIVIIVCSLAGMVMKLRIKPKKKDKIIDFSVLRDYRFLLLSLESLMHDAGYLIPFFYMPIYTTVVLGEGKNWGIIVSSILNATSVLGRIAIGALSEKIGTQNAMVIANLFMALSIFGLWLPFNTLGALVAAATLFGMTSGGAIGIHPVLSAELFGVNRFPTLMGLLYIAFTAGSLICSPVGGALLDKYGHGSDFSSLILYCGATFAVCTILILALRLSINKKLFVMV